MKRHSSHIGFEEQRVSCIIGIHPHERVQEQDIFIDLRVEVNFPSGESAPQISDTVDYVALANLCSVVAKEGRHQLLETLAVDIIDAIMERFPVNEVRIKIRKPEALPEAAFAFVEFLRER